MRVELVFERSTSCTLCFSSRDKLILFQTGLLSRTEKTHVSLEGKAFMLEGGAFSTLFSLRTELVFKGILLSHQGIKGGEMHILFQMAYSAELKKHMYPQKKPSMLEGGASSTLFLCGKHVSF
jgi:hypothetical protein